MKIGRKLVQAAIAGGVLAVIVACGGGGSGAAGPGDLPGAGLPGTAEGLPAAEGSATSDVCDRLTDSEVTQVIGPNDGGQQDYLLGGCVWTATSRDQEGFADAIYATVLPKAQYEVVAEIGEPVTGFVDGATYSDIHGELWFPCRGGDFCGIKASIDSDKREETAMKLGRLLQGRA